MKYFNSPIKQIIILSIIIIILEALIMLVIDDISAVTKVPEIIIDPLLLSLILTPAFYYFLFKPMQQNMREKDKLLSDFKTANEIINQHEEELKLEVRKQTKALNDELEDKKIINEKLRLFSRGVEQSANSIVITDVKGNIQYVNPKFCKITGYSADEVIGQNPRILKTNYQPPMVYTQLWGTITNGGEWTGEFRNKKKNGEIYWELAAISPIFNDEGKITNYIGVKENITERKLAEKLLSQSLQRQNVLNQVMQLSVSTLPLNKILDKALQFLISVDWLKIESKGAIFLSNNNSELELISTINFDPELVVICRKVPFGTCFCGRTAQDKKLIFSNTVNHEHENSFEGMCDHGHYTIPIILNEKIYGVIVLYLEVGHKYSNDETKFLETVAKTLALIIEKRNSDESINQYYSQLKRKQNDLQILNEELKQVNISKDKFFSIISHDLRSPFSALLAHTRMLVEMYEDLTEEEIKESIFSINESSEQTFGLLNDLLEWARAQSNNMPFSPDEIDLHEMIQNVIKLLNRNACDKKLILVNSVAPNTKIFADENMIETVIRNLVSNAIKFTAEDGKIEINYLLNDTENGVICVSDSGVGISEKDRNELFRIDVHHTTVGTNSEIGSGVGLILCKELVERNGGNIWVESKLGEGSQFKFAIPLKKDGN